MAEEQQSVGPASVGREDVGPASVGHEDVGPSSAAPEASIGPAYSVQLQIGFVGNIRLAKLLSNHSGEADVWAGERPNGERVAVKIYRHGRLPGLMDERQKCALSHPHLLPILEAGEIEGRYFEVCPFVATGTLTEWIRQRRQLSEADCKQLVEQLASAIHYLHNQNVLHRDIKPSNIFVTQTDPLQVTLADFGTARLGGYQTILTGTVGTVAYSSPEAVTGMQSEASDYWSLGMVLIEALTGRQPFAGLDVKQQLYRVAGGKIEIPEAISPRWKQLLTGLLTVDYTVRWRKKEIDQWLNNERQPELIYSAPLPAPPRPAPTERRSPALTVRLQRAPETIQLTPTDIVEVVGDNIRISVLRYFWVVFLVGGTSHNEWLSLLALGLIMGVQTGFQFLPFRLQDLKREIRVNRQLRHLSWRERRSLRRMVRAWLRSVGDKDEQAGSGRRRDH
jgi:serine/threonine protein kinase